MNSYAEKYIKKAIEIANKEPESMEVPIGCVIVKNDVMIAYSSNETIQTNMVTSHAEISAIQKANQVLNNWRLEECDLFVTMEPCLMCMGAVILSRIRAVYYGLPNYITGAFHGNIPIQDSSLKTYIVSGICEVEIKEMIQEFFKKHRNKKDESY